jgi:tetratricopeptide (TPR) repeat protein
MDLLLNVLLEVYSNKFNGGSIIPILLFGSRHVELITGKKTATIRKLWKKPLSPGDRLHCYWNLVSKERKKLFEATVTDVEVVKFGALIKNDSLAREEGYSDAKELEVDFRKIYPDDTDDSSLFQVIRFKKLPIENWEGKKIDEKSMITKRADILFDVGKFNKSVVCYSAALKFDPNDVYLLNKKGDNLSRLGRFEEAIECYDKAINLDSHNEYIYNNKAIALLNSNQPKKALKCSDKAMEINSKNEFVLYWRGFILEMLGKFESALECYDKIIEMNPEDPDVWNAKGNILSELDRTEEALFCYEKALELCLEEPPDAAMWNRKGNALMELGRFEEALHCYDEALAMENENDAFICNRGVAFLELNRFNSAIECFRRALVINPSNEDARILKDECLENL